MEMLSSHDFWIGLLKIIWVNLLLSGDNAVVIALAADPCPSGSKSWRFCGAVALPSCCVSC